MQSNRVLKGLELGFWHLMVAALGLLRPIGSSLLMKRASLTPVKLLGSSFAMQLAWALGAWLIGAALGYLLFS